MIVYCDTSFLVSYLNEDDANHKSARTTVDTWDSHNFVVCEVHLLELPAAVRAAVHRSADAIPEHVARRVINRFDRAVNSNFFFASRWTWRILSTWRGLWGIRTDGRNGTRHLIYGTWLLHGRCRPECF